MTRKLYYIVFRKVKKKHPHWSNKQLDYVQHMHLKIKRIKFFSALILSHCRKDMSRKSHNNRDKERRKYDTCNR